MQIQVVQTPRDRAKIWVGAAIYGALFLLGAFLLLVFLASDVIGSKHPGEYLVLMVVGAGISFAAVLVYLLVPILVDRFDPEPWWALALAFLWGGVVACGFSGWINTIVGDIGRGVNPLFGDLVGGVVSAPITEEFWKGLLVALMFFFLRREFDGVVDGVIYATFTALGFAAVENVLYYARAGIQDKMLFVVVLRGVFSPWCHPLFTSMTGIGFGIARETKSTAIKILAPVGGYALAVMLHAGWNGSVPIAALATGSDSVAGLTLVAMILLFIVFMLVFTGVMIALVVREGRIIRKFLHDEVLIGTLTQEESDWVCSPFGRIRALFTRGGLRGRAFVGAACKLALKKWHTARAMEGRKDTVSVDFIVPLRQDIARIRSELGLAPAQMPAMAVAAPVGYPVPPTPPGYPHGGRPGFAPQPQAYPPQQPPQPGFAPQPQAYPPQQPPQPGFAPQPQAYPPQQPPQPGFAPQPQAYPPQQPPQPGFAPQPQAYPPQQPPQPGFPPQGPGYPPGPGRGYRQ